MSNLRVVPLRTAKDEESEAMVKDLEMLLGMARKGEITDMVIGAQCADGVIMNFRRSVDRKPMVMIGLGHYLAHRVAMDLYDSPSIDVHTGEDDDS